MHTPVQSTSSQYALSIYSNSGYPNNVTFIFQYKYEVIDCVPLCVHEVLGAEPTALYMIDNPSIAKLHPNSEIIMLQNSFS